MGLRLLDDRALIGATLRSARIFSAWSDDEFKALCALSQLRRFRRGEVLCLYGDAIDGLWIVAEGSLVSHRDNRDGRRRIQGVVMPGELYGIAPVFDGKPALTTVSARSDPAVVVFVPREGFLALARAREDHLNDIILYFANRLRIDYERAHIERNTSLRCRMAKYVAYYSGEDFHPRLDGEAVDWAPPVALTQEEIAAMMGVSRQSVSATMRSMVREGVLVRRGQQFRVADYEKLLAMMEEDEPTAPDWRAAMLARHELLCAHRAAARQAAGKVRRRA